MESNWCSKKGSQRRAAAIPPPPPQAQPQRTASEAHSWFMSFFSEFQSFPNDMRNGLYSLQENYSSLDQHLTQIEQARDSSSHGDSMDTSSIPYSNDSLEEDKEENEGDKEGDDKEEEIEDDGTEETEKEDEASKEGSKEENDDEDSTIGPDA
ncbi:uncharacterized protein LOC131155985 [Malania oleifera]|uniref:uncharacterized protein LOC131155985 n=1 Tax=Malania oleifera TaxID=397392 RepID=UPI0025ADBE52|nr:uncharacterized protein LOC131155985 [Malania oleifera]